MTIKDLEITVDDKLLDRAPRIVRSREIYIPYCTRTKDVCSVFANGECVYYKELLVEK